MKKFLLILGLFVFTGSYSFAQDETDNEKIREKMGEFIQKRMKLTKAEAERFNPIFIRYFREWRQAMRDNKANTDPLDRQQRILELRIRYRNEFKEIIGEKRSNQVYKEQQIFIDGLKDRVRDKPMRKNQRSMVQ